MPWNVPDLDPQCFQQEPAPPQSPSRSWISTLLIVRAPCWPLSCLLLTTAHALWVKPLTYAPSCVVPRDRVPYRRDSGASACKTSPPLGEMVLLLPQVPLRQGLGGPAANTASLRCPGVLLKALAAQVGVTSLPSFPSPSSPWGLEAGPCSMDLPPTQTLIRPWKASRGAEPHLGQDRKLGWGL